MVIFVVVSCKLRSSQHLLRERPPKKKRERDRDREKKSRKEGGRERENG
jgi:hypothetical protein